MSGGLLPPNPAATWSVNGVPTAAGMNAIRDALNAAFNKAHFKGTLTPGTAVSAGTNIAYTAAEDNYSGWDGTNHWWVVPSGWGGLYEVVIQFKWGSTTPSANQVIGLFGGASGTTALAHSPDPAAIIANGGNTLQDYVRVSAGDKIGVQSLNSGFTSSTDTVEAMFFNFNFYSL
jgi:hypothetical protein